MTWLLCDYGEVLSEPQPLQDRAALVSTSGLPEEEFWPRYWLYRPAYDRGDTGSRTYWESVLGAFIPADRVHDLVALDVASWLHQNPPSVAAAVRAGERGYSLAILSNAPLEIAAALDAVPWLQPFSPRLFSCYLRSTKPHSAIYQLAIDHLRAEPTDIVFFDDRPDNVTAALAAGIRAQHFTSPSQFEALPPV